MLWKVCAQEVCVGSLLSEKKPSSTMKEGLDEVVQPDLSDNCLQIVGQQVFSVSCASLVS